MSAVKEKSDTLLPSTTPVLVPRPQTSPKPSINKTAILVFFIWAAVVWRHLLWNAIWLLDIRAGSNWAGQDFCPQADVLTPQKNNKLWESLGATIGTAEFKERAIDWLGGAVRVPWVTFCYNAAKTRMLMCLICVEQNRLIRWVPLAKMIGGRSSLPSMIISRQLFL